MCLCSELQDGNTACLNDQEAFDSITRVLNAVKNHLSANPKLSKAFPFALELKASRSIKRKRRIFEWKSPDQDTLHFLDQNFESWSQKPINFWERLPTPQVFSYSNDPQCYLVFSCLQLEARDFHSRILRRLYCLLLHELSQTSEALDHEIVVSTLKERHQGLNNEDLSDQVKALISAGSRYAKIAKELGPGILFVIGHDISNSMLEKRLSLDELEDWIDLLNEKVPTIEQSAVYLKLGREIYKTKTAGTWINENTISKRRKTVKSQPRKKSDHLLSASTPRQQQQQQSFPTTMQQDQQQQHQQQQQQSFTTLYVYEKMTIQREKPQQPPIANPFSTVPVQDQRHSSIAGVLQESEQSNHSAITQIGWNAGLEQAAYDTNNANSNANGSNNIGTTFEATAPTKNECQRTAYINPAYIAYPYLYPDYMPFGITNKT